MTRFTRSLLFVSLLLFSVNLCFSQDEKRGFDVDLLEELRADSDFQYELLQPEPEGFFSRLWNRFVNWFNGFFQSQGSRSALDFLFKLGLAIAFVYFLVKILGGDINSMIKPKAKSLSLEYDVDEEEIHEIDFEKEVEKAFQSNNLRLVIRLYYLQALKQASDAEWVVLMQGKTNYEYLFELKGRPIETEFKSLSYLFDYTWYGHFEANKQLVEKAGELVNQILKKRGGDEQHG